MRTVLTLSAALAGFVALSAPAAAQEAAAANSERMNMVIVYGDDPCPQSANGEITVCARKGEQERYRIPEPFRGAASPQNEAWTNKVIAYETVGRHGTQSCSPTGAGGWTGCSNKLINAAYAEKANSPDVQFSRLIEAEREKRLSTLESEATATQSRVEQLEREYEARRAAQESTSSANAPSPAGSTPTVVTPSAVPNTVGGSRP